MCLTQSKWNELKSELWHLPQDKVRSENKYNLFKIHRKIGTLELRSAEEKNPLSRMG